MNKKLLTLGVATAAVVGAIGLGSLNASAADTVDCPVGNKPSFERGNGRGNGYATSLESRAQVLGMSADELESALKEKTMSQIALEKGMDEDTFRSKMGEAAQKRWAERGFSEEEIAKRIAEREQRHEANMADHEFGSGAGNHQGGYGRNR